VKDKRDALFAVEGSQRGKYPQCFLRSDDGAVVFIGLWDKIEELVECDTLPADILEANPNIETFSKVLKSHSLFAIHCN